jgi:uncharacterized protein (TIRG00374 family)
VTPSSQDRAAEPPAVRREDLDRPPDLTGPRVRRRLLVLASVAVAVVAVVTLAPGLASLRQRLAAGDPGWLALGAALKVLSGLSYAVAFRSVFCSRMKWRASIDIGFSELGANAVLPVGGAGGLAVGAWALRRGGMDAGRIARRSVAFFFLTSVPNVLGVIVLGIALAVGLLRGSASLPLTLGPAAVAFAAVVATMFGRRWASAAERKLRSRRGQASRIATALRALSGGIEDALTLIRHTDASLLVGLVGYLAFDVMVLWATFHAFGSAPPLAIIWIGYLIGELGGLIPLPGGIGGVDLGLVGALVLYRVPVNAATAAVLGYRALALVVPFALGAIAFVRLRRSVAREALAVASCAPGGEVEVVGVGQATLVH